MKMREHYPGGELHLLGVESAERAEIVRIIRNEEERARQKNPLERIMQLQAKDGDWRVETTTEKLAQRLGRSIKKARGGKIEYKWGHNNKFVRVIWEKIAE
jgi:NADH:ubiquinone oxidoreductase subunit E